MRKLIVLLVVLVGSVFAQQVNQDIIPASTGLNLGHSNQQWNAFLQNLTIYGTCTYAGTGQACSGQPIGSFTVATLPTNLPIGSLAQVTDTSAGSCTVGGGSTVLLCRWNGFTWSAIGGSGSTAFSALTPGTNTLGAMVVGTGSSLTTSGTGFIGGAGQFQSATSQTGFQAISPSVPSLIMSPDPSGTCSYPPTLTSGQNMLCEPSNGLVWMNPGSGPIQAFFTALPTSSAFVNGAVPQWVAANGDYEILPISSTGSVAFSALSGGNNSTATMSITGSASLVSTGTGQLIGNSNWFNLSNGSYYPAIPTFTISNTGGSLTQGTYFFRLTYVGFSASVPGGEVRVGLNTTNCASNSTCQITVNMPTNCTSGNLPVGITGCTVWDSKAAGNNTVNVELQQAASNACVNITASTCVVNTLAAGSSLTFPTSSGVVPSLITSYPVPDGIIPTTYMQLGDGSYVPQGGVDYSALNIVTPYNVTGSNVNCPAVGCLSGRYTWFGPWVFNDTNAAPIQANNLVSVHHLAGQTTGTVGTSGQNGVDDRGFGVEVVDGSTSTPFFEQSLSQYNERIVSNNSFTCDPVNGSAPWGETCASAGRFVFSDIRSAPTVGFASPPAALAAAAASNTPNGTTFSSCGFPTPCIVGVQAGAFEGTLNQNGQGGLWAGGYFGANGTSGNTNGSGAGLVIAAPTTRFATNNFGLVTTNMGSTNGDWAIYVYGATSNGNSHNYFGGPVLYSQANYGTVVPSQISTPTNNLTLTATSCSGSTTWQYSLVPKDMAGGFAPATSVAGGLLKTTAGCATLTGSNFLTIQANNGGTGLNAGEVYGRYAFDVYRTTAGGTPNTTGYIGTVVCNFASGCTFADTGIAVTIPPNDDPGTQPAYNTSGRIAGYTLGDINTCQAVGSGASPSIASCSAATAGFISCATNASGATCQVNTTAITAHSQIEIHQREDTNAGTVLGVTCNTTDDSNAKNAISAVSPGVSFTFKVGTINTNPNCYSFTIRN